MLEVAESDMTKELEEITSVEMTAAKLYEDESKKNKMETLTKSQDVKYKIKEVKGLEASLTELNTDKTGVTDELTAVLEYYDKIKGECVSKPDSYEEIKKRREEEMAGLKDALKTLESEAFVQLASS